MSDHSPKNEILEGQKKAQEKVFIKEIHSCPELMSYAERLEFGQEVLSELLLPILEREGLNGQIDEVQDNALILTLSQEPSVTLRLELEHMVWEETQGVFRLLMIRSR